MSMEQDRFEAVLLEVSKLAGRHHRLSGDALTVAGCQADHGDCGVRFI